MITRQALLDIMLQQREMINLLNERLFHNYRINSKAIALTHAEKNYWKARAEKAEDELIDLKLFGKTQPQQPQP